MMSAWRAEAKARPDGAKAEPPVAAGAEPGLPAMYSPSRRLTCSARMVSMYSCRKQRPLADSEGRATLMPEITHQHTKQEETCSVNCPEYG